MSVSDWSASELAAEITDIRETVAHITARIVVAESELAAQRERTAKAYGENAAHWPASSTHAVRTLEDRVQGLHDRRADCHAYLCELETV